MQQCVSMIFSLFRDYMLRLIFEHFRSKTKLTEGQDWEKTPPATPAPRTAPWIYGSLTRGMHFVKKGGDTPSQIAVCL